VRSGSTIAHDGCMAYAQTLENYSGYGIERGIQSAPPPPRARFQYGTDAQMVTFETLSETPRLGWLDRIVRVVNSAILQ
jgi:hypothetical protein